MRALLITALLLLGACASPLPAPDPQQAWVDMRYQAGDLLMADRLDGKRWPDGRYFQFSPGAHELQTRFMFEVNVGPLTALNDPIQMTCEIRLRYDGFAAGQRYRLQAWPQFMKARAILFDEQGNELARGQVLRCGTTI